MRECEDCAEKNLVSWAVMTRRDGREVCVLHTKQESKK